MTRNFKIGLSLFFKELKNRGVLYGYIKNFMEYHHLTSPVRIPERLFNNVCNSSSVICKWQQPSKNTTALQFYETLCINFGNTDISFVWDLTPEGEIYWRQINGKLCNINTVIKKNGKLLI